MRYFLFAAIFLLGVTQRSFSLYVQTTKISLDLKNLRDSTSFFLLRERSDGMGSDTLEIAKSIKGNVVFKSMLPANGERIFITINHAEMGISFDKPFWFTLFLDGPVIHVTGDALKWPVLNIEGSDNSTIYNDFYNKDDVFVKRLNALLRTMAETKTRDSSQFKNGFAEYKEFSLEYFRKYRDVPITPLMVAQSYPLSFEEKKQLWSEMSDEIRGNQFGKELEKKLVEFEREAVAKASVSSSNVAVGELLPDFKMETPEGTAVSIRDLVSRNEFTLIDFWAYWCGPCREAVPKLKIVYEKYRDQGFNIVGISVDPNREKWEKALKELDTKWDNLLDVGKISKPIFNTAAIPAYVLVNKKAEIVAMTVVGSEKNGGSDKYFSPGEKIFLSGSTMEEIMEKLLSKK